MHPYLSSRARLGRGHQLLLGLIFAAAVAAFLGGPGLTSAAQAAASPLPNVNYHAKFLHSGGCPDNSGRASSSSERD